jgi:Domain of unknown function (DUF4760)
MFDWLVSWKEAAPAIGACIAAMSAFVAALVFRHTRQTNRRRATLDMVMKTLLDESSQKRYAEFKGIIRRDKDVADCFKLASLADPNTEDQHGRQIVLSQLNIYELMSLGIRRGLFDGAFYKLWFCTQFLADYESSASFIEAAKARRPAVYCEFTALYQKWSSNGHPKLSPSRLRMAWWALNRNSSRIEAAMMAQKAR